MSNPVNWSRCCKVAAFAQNLEAVADGFDAGVSATAEAVGVKENGQGCPDPDAVNVTDGF
jgi:hypothetical protein